MWRVINSTFRPLYSRERPGIHHTGGWVGPRVVLDGWEKIYPTTGFRSPDRQPRSESLYRLSYRGPKFLSLPGPRNVTAYCMSCLCHIIAMETRSVYVFTQVAALCSKLPSGGQSCNLIRFCNGETR